MALGDSVMPSSGLGYANNSGSIGSGSTSSPTIPKDTRSRKEQRRNPQTTTSTAVNLPPGASDLSKWGVNLIKGFTPPKLSENANDLVAPFNPTQLKAQQMALGSAPKQQAVMDSAAKANIMATSGELLSPESNPALKAWQDAAGRPLIDAYLEQVMPGISAGAADAGQFGSSRHGVAQGIASKGLMYGLGDTNANIANQGYAQGLQAMMQGLGLAPQTAAGQNIPAATVGAVGDVQQGQTQGQMDAVQNAKWTNAMMPWLFGQDLIGVAGSIPGGSQTTVAQAPRTGPLASMIGGATAGASMFPNKPILSALVGGGLGLGGYFAG